MTYEKDKPIMESTAATIAKALVGKTIASVEMPVEYPGNYSRVEIKTTDGCRLTIREIASGCNECNPDGLKDGVEVDFGSKR